MKGKVNLRIRTSIIGYDVELIRKISFLKGNSGSGKTTLYDIVSEYKSREDIRDKIDFQVSGCNQIVTFRDLNDWLENLKKYKGCLIILDEDTNEGIMSRKMFSSDIKKSDNYFLIIYRDKIHNISCSTESIYELVAYNDNGLIVNKNKMLYNDVYETVKPDLILSEDSNSGYKFFKDTVNCDVVSVHGRSNMVYYLEEYLDSEEYSLIYVVADAENFGYNLEGILEILGSEDYKRSSTVVKVFLPRSFEWLLLKTDIFFDEDVSIYTDNTEDYCETTLYKNWEKFYSVLLSTGCIKTFKGDEKVVTRKGGYWYKKKELNSKILDNGNVLKVYEFIPDIDKSLIRGN